MPNNLVMHPNASQSAEITLVLEKLMRLDWKFQQISDSNKNKIIQAVRDENSQLKFFHDEIVEATDESARQTRNLILKQLERNSKIMYLIICLLVIVPLIVLIGWWLRLRKINEMALAIVQSNATTDFTAINPSHSPTVKAEVQEDSQVNAMRSSGRVAEKPLSDSLIL